MNIITDLIKNTKQQCIIHVISDNFSIGDYVFLSKYSDADPNDPWFIGRIDEIGLNKKGAFIRCHEAGQRYWRNAIKINKETGNMLLSVLANYR
jgi:hypothetical protein